MYERVLMSALLAGVMTMAAQPAAAQGAGTVGVTMGYPGALGVVWHITDRLALRPDVAITRTDAETVTTPTGSFAGVPGLTSTSRSESWGSTVGLSALVTVSTIDRLRLYLVPRVAYSRTTADNETGLEGALSGYESTTTGVTASGSFGTQLSLHDRFAVFGELGLQYSTQSTTSDFLGARNESEGTSFGLRSAIGVTFYF